MQQRNIFPHPQKCVAYVVYFDQLLGAARTQKLVEQLFQPFSAFFSFQTFLNDFTAEINKKCLKKNNKNCLCLLLKAG